MATTDAPVDRSSAVVARLVLISFVAVFFAAYVPSVFFDEYGMQFFQTVPAAGTMGIDLQELRTYVRMWLWHAQSPYASHGNPYPPLTILFYSPLAAIGLLPAFVIVTSMTLASYVFMALLFPTRFARSRGLSVIVTFGLITGLFSYGLHFDIANGQFNSTSMGLGLLGLYLYHAQPRWRYAGYLLFSIGIQLKLFPAILVFAFTKDLRDWKGNLRRTVGLGTFNILLLFVLGPQICFDFVRDVLMWARTSEDVCVQHHSLFSYTRYSFEGGVLEPYAQGLTSALTVFVFLCLGVVYYVGWKRGWSGLNPFLLVACTATAALAPTISYDYKLPILVGPAVLFLNEYRFRTDSRAIRLFEMTLVAAFCVAYQLTLYSFAVRPFPKNAAPLILTMLVTATLAAAVSRVDWTRSRFRGTLMRSES